MIRKLNNNIDKLVYYSLLFCILICPVSMFIKYTALYLDFDNVFLYIDLLKCYKIILPIQAIAYLLCLKKSIIKLNKFDYIMYVLIFTNIISCLFAMDFNAAVNGYFNRYEGFIALLSYYLMFLNSRLLNKKYVNKLLNSIIYIGIFNSLYAILQVIFKAAFVMKFRWFWMASGLNINPNFFGTYMCTVGLLSICIYLFSNKRKLFYFISSIIMMIGLVLSQSTGPVIGYFFGIFILLIILLYRKINVWNKLFKLGIVLIITFLTTVYGTDYLFNNIYKYDNTDSYTIKGDIDRIIIYGCDLFGIDAKRTKENTHLVDTEDITLDDISSNRFTIWKKSLPIIKDHWLVGVGIDNFGIAHGEYYGDRLTDKVHNVYLQILVTNGVIGFIPYMIWLVMVFIKGFKIRKEKMLILLIPAIGYSFQAIFNISVIDVAPIFYILSGMIVGFKEE